MLSLCVVRFCLSAARWAAAEVECSEEARGFSSHRNSTEFSPPFPLPVTVKEWHWWTGLGWSSREVERIPSGPVSWGLQRWVSFLKIETCREWVKMDEGQSLHLRAVESFQLELSGKSCSFTAQPNQLLSAWRDENWKDMIQWWNKRKDPVMKTIDVLFSCKQLNSTPIFRASSLSLFTVASPLNCSFLGASPLRLHALCFLWRLTLDMLCVCAHVAARGTPQTGPAAEPGENYSRWRRTWAGVRYKHTSGVECLYTLWLGQQNTTLEQCQSCWSAFEVNMSSVTVTSDFDWLRSVFGN